MKESDLQLHYSMVFIIHGDGDYLYHDTNGRIHRADEVTLTGAKSIAELNPQAEVFIFHQKPGRHTLLFFPCRDGTFYYYRNGRLLTQESYWRALGSSRFNPEVELYNRFHAENQSQQVRLFLYFGHEIPEVGGVGYDASRSNRLFTVQDLANGIKQFTHDSRFDLVVLSTCFGGTPHTIAALAPYTRAIVASPDNLHLSYFALYPFERLDIGLQNRDVVGFAKNFARQAFNWLREDVQTVVTVTVYDIDRVQGYLQSVESEYENSLLTLQGQTPGSFERCDCAEDSTYVLPGMSNGVDVFFRPPQFGRLKHKHNHSGWECYKLLNNHYSISQSQN